MNSSQGGFTSERLYDVNPSNAHKAILAKDLSSWMKVLEKLHREPLAQDWSEIDLTLDSAPKRRHFASPRIGCAYSASAVVIEDRLCGELFRAKTSPAYELLPLRVEGDAWWLLNCLATAAEVDENNSELFRDPDGTIFMVQRLELVERPSTPISDFFVLRESNRSRLYVREREKKRWSNVGVPGISFGEVGCIRTASPEAI